ncbi:hypothetical protein [Desulfovibrio sp. 1214_IL3152]|uniref:hypothetical protein n=1 Tax=Desulfovibrio sp. 1214_IL3152 TaxID=3084056 RepID=UPI002FD95FFA
MPKSTALGAMGREPLGGMPGGQKQKHDLLFHQRFAAGHSRRFFVSTCLKKAFHALANKKIILIKLSGIKNLCLSRIAAANSAGQESSFLLPYAPYSPL